jgi:hypothetical protein
MMINHQLWCEIFETTREAKKKEEKAQRHLENVLHASWNYAAGLFVLGWAKDTVQEQRKRKSNKLY